MYKRLTILGLSAALLHGCASVLMESDYARDSEQDTAHGWSDIQHLKAGDTVSKTYTDTTQATGPIERTIVYQAPFFKPDREQDYATAWTFFEKQGGTK